MSDTLKGVSEDNVLTMLVWNETHAVTLAAVLTHELFSDQIQRRIAEVAIDYIDRFGHPPRHHIKDLLEKELRRPGNSPSLMLTILDAMEKLHPTLQPQYVIAELDKFIRIRRRFMAMDEAYVALQQGDEEKADDVLWQGTGVSQRHTEGVWLHDTDPSFMTTAINDDNFTSGIEALDAKGVKPARGTLTMFMAPRKFGKSWSCINIGKSSMRYHKKVLHITLENSEALTKRRYVQAIWSMSKRQVEQAVDMPVFTRNKLTDEWIGNEVQQYMPISLTEDNLKLIIERLGMLKARPPILIKQFPTGSLTLSQYNAYLDYLERTFSFIPDLVIMDYPELMMIDSRNQRIDIGRTFTKLRGIAVDRNHALYCPSQGNRDSLDSKWVTSKHTAEDWSKTGTADTILTFCRTPQERSKGLARIWVDAARDEADSFAVMITQNYTVGQFCLDSVLMHGAVAEEFDRITSDRSSVIEEEG